MFSRRNLLLVGAVCTLILVFRLTSTTTLSQRDHPADSDNIDSPIATTLRSPLLSQPFSTVKREQHDDGSLSTAGEASIAIISSNNNNSSNNKKKKKQKLLNGVILYLSGGRWESYFTQHALPRLDEYFVSCYPYPVLVFHEAAPEQRKQEIRNALPKGDAAFKKRLALENGDASSSSIVQFDDVSDFWRHLPASVSEQQLQQWLKDPTQRKFQGRGYRVMCRFWAGSVWLRQSLDKYEYYWRLDTDSILTRPVLADPFRLVFLERKCVYGFNRLKGENPHVAVGLFDTFKSFLDSVSEQDLTASEKKDCIHWVTHRSDGLADGGGHHQFWAPMYYNNFEMGTMALKRSVLYQRFFRWVDERPPFGIFRYRWGDAPIHTLGILVSLRCSTVNFCNVTADQVAYRHAVTRMPPMAVSECKF